MMDFRTAPRSDIRLDTRGIAYQYPDLVCPGPVGTEILFDLYLPEPVKRPCPVVVNVAGGGWFFGIRSSRHLGSFVHMAVAQGYAFVSMACTSSHDRIFPWQMQELLCMLRFLRAQGSRWGLDPDGILLWAASSGAHTSLMAALAAGIPGLDEPGQTAESARVRAVAALYPICRLGTPAQAFHSVGLEPQFDCSGPSCVDSILIGAPVEENPELCRRASPESYITPAAPPLLLLHGMADRTVCYTASADFVKRYRRAVGSENVLARFLPGAGHSDPRFKDADGCQGVLDFFGRVLRGQPPCPERYRQSDLCRGEKPFD